MDIVNRDTILDTMYTQYWITVSFVNTVINIQSFWRRAIARKAFKKLKEKIYKRLHKQTYLDVIADIWQYGYIPPDPSLPLFREGGYHYREAHNRYIYLKLSMK